MAETAPAVDTALNLEKSEPQLKTSSSEFITGWYVARLGRYWCIANIISAALVLAVVWGNVPVGLSTGWCVFVVLNALLFLFSTDRRPLSHDFDTLRRSSTVTTIGGILGLAWGSVMMLAGPYLSSAGFVQAQLVVLLVAATAVPVFALQNGAYSIFCFCLALIGIPACVLYATAPLATAIFVFSLGVLFIAAAYVAHTQRVTNRLLGRYLSLGGGEFNFLAGDLDAFHTVGERRLRNLARLLPEHVRMSSCLNAVAEAVITTNQSGVIEYLNPVAEVMSGVSRANAVGRPIGECLKFQRRDDQELITNFTDAFGHSNSPTQIKREVEMLREDGMHYQAELQVLPITSTDGIYLGATCVLRDTSLHQQMAKQAHWRSTHDPLTELINRIEFEDRLQKSINDGGADTATTHAMCFVDIDQFNFFNESHGHQCGDALLTALANEFRGKIRGADTLARIGDNKFGVLLYGCAIDKARMIAEGLRRLAEQTRIEFQGSEVAATVSVGVVEIDPDTDASADVLIAAEGACAIAKSEGGNRVHVSRCSDENRDLRSETMNRLRHIRDAMRDGQFSLYFNEIHPIAANSDDNSACEIVLRMSDEAGQLISPRDLVVTAERFQLMPEIDRWAAKATFDALRAKHPSLREKTTIFINVSGQSLNDDRFLDFVVNELDDEEIPTERICFEISEATLISSIERACYFVAALKDFGCRVALNDFGLAMNSFEMMKRLQIDYLKIDSQLIRNMGHNSVDYEIVLALCRIAKSLRVQTIAEGVSTYVTKDTLVGMGVDFVQGYLVDEPQAITQNG